MTGLAPLPIEIEPWKTEATGAGNRWIYRFANSYGASVVQGPYTYGGGYGLYELAVLAFNGNDWALTYDTPVTDEVIGWLDIPEVAEKLAAIAALPDGHDAYSKAKKSRDEAMQRMREAAKSLREAAQS